ncbi:MAG TPA: NAD-dependent epimerase/dehydratase family protein [Polyangiaceae bacterium]|nr:NAD-dependent epimerase/dehydratase family protein [Polyangiaceae bacterium]
MRVLLTGISGKLAQQVALELLSRGHRVVGIDRRPWPECPTNISVVQTDIRKPEAEEAFRRERPEAVIHMATVSHVTMRRDERYRINLGGTQKVFEYCERHGVPQALFVGRHTYYGAVPDAALYRGEDEPPMALESFPELADLVAADLFAASALWRFPERTTAVLRLVYTLGPSLHGTLAAFLAGPRVPMILGFDPLFQFMHESDAVRAIILALERKLRGVYNVAGPQALPLSELIRVTGRSPIRIARVLHPLLLGRLGLPRLSPGAVAHIKYPIVISDASFRQVTGFRPEHGEYETLAAFRVASPPPGEAAPPRPPEATAAELPDNAPAATPERDAVASAGDPKALTIAAAKAPE